MKHHVSALPRRGSENGNVSTFNATRVSIEQAIEQRAVTFGRIAVLIAAEHSALNLVEAREVVTAAEENAAIATFGLTRRARGRLAARLVARPAAAERGRRTLLLSIEAGQVGVADLEVSAAAAKLAGLARRRKTAATERVAQDLATAELLDVEAGAIHVANPERTSEASELSVFTRRRRARGTSPLEAELTERGVHALLHRLERRAAVIAALEPALGAALLAHGAGRRRALGGLALERRFAELLTITRRERDPPELVVCATLQLALVATALARGAGRCQALARFGDAVCGRRALVEQLPAVAVRVAHLQHRAVTAQLVERARRRIAAGRRCAAQGRAAADRGRDPARAVGRAQLQRRPLAAHGTSFTKTLDPSAVTTTSAAKTISAGNRADRIGPRAAPRGVVVGTTRYALERLDIDVDLAQHTATRAAQNRQASSNAQADEAACHGRARPQPLA